MNPNDILQWNSFIVILLLDDLHWMELARIEYSGQ